MTNPLKLDIDIHESAGINRHREPVRLGLPVPKGELETVTKLAISAPDASLHPCQTRTLNHWPDGSIKWLLVDFLATVPAYSTTAWQLVQHTEILLPETPISIRKSDDCWIVDTGVGAFSLDTHIFRPFKEVTNSYGDSVTLTGSVCRLSLDGINNLASTINEMMVEEDGPLRTVIRLVGEFQGSELRYQCRLHFTAGSMQVKFAMTLHNPQAACHPQGLWDLGDRGSIVFRELTFEFVLPDGIDRKVCCYPELTSEPVVSANGAELSIYQESSGGENWKSPNHRNQNGSVILSRQGYQVSIDNCEIHKGLRATPLVWSGEAGQGVAAVNPLFWQEFPKQIKASQNELQVSIFPACFPDMYELQGGEQKTHEFYLDFSADQESLRWALSPLTVMALPDVYRAAATFADLPSDEDLVDQFATADDFFGKRDAIDEYGWRNFGEIYADHEAAYHKVDKLLISHYNNQYDFIAGAYRKAFASGDFGWLTIATDLARHVRDIDLYHTDLDREEYNHGLFWHTDHYADAGLSTHRSYSKEQQATYELYAGGGGPGAEHCYTTGLALHYFLTGNASFKNAVIHLAEWELLTLNGPQTVLAALKRGVDNLRNWRASSGEKKPFPGYPLTRGTGNAITACLDAYEITGDRRWVIFVEDILKNTFHPDDDIASRDLLNAELGWSYTVLLVSVAKYLDKKNELKELDTSFHHARQSLLHYASWMAEHEYPYLDKPDILEYPNETWTAQDLRKSVVLYHAARYAENEKQYELYRQKAIFFYDYASVDLPKHLGSHFSRPVVLMLQNGWVGSKLRDTAFVSDGKQFYNVEHTGKPVPYLTAGSVVRRLFWDLGRVLKQTSARREVAWLRVRLKG